MRAAFYKKDSVNGTLVFVAFAITEDPEREFTLLVSGEVDHEAIFSVWGHEAPALDITCVLGIGSDERDAATRIIMDAKDVLCPDTYTPRTTS